jgi:ankyrin repeat protein
MAVLCCIPHQKLLFAILDKPKEILQSFLENGASANATGVDIMAMDPRASTQPVEGSILHAASRRGRVELVQLLISMGAQVNTKDTTGFSALHYAAQMGHKECAVALIRSSADVNALTPDRWTPLHAAAQAGFSEIVRLLLENGADPMRKTGSGQLPSAVTSSSVILGLLPSISLSSSGGIPSSSTTAASSAPVAVPRSAPITLAGASQASSSASSLAQSPKSGSPKLATSPPGSPVLGSRQPKTALSSSPSKPSSDAGNEAPVSSLWVAAAAGNVSAVAESLSHGDVDLNLLHLDGSTPLWIACFRGHLEVVKLLCSHADTDVELKHKKLGTTPLFAACASGHSAIAKVLLEKGAQVHTEDKQGDTVLHVAAMNGNLEIVQTMLSNSNFILSVAVNEQNDEGATSLFLAAANGHANVVQALLAAAASADIRNMSGLTPLDVAIKNNHTPVWKLLTAHLKELIAKERTEMEAEQKALNELLERARPLQTDSTTQVDIKCSYNNKIRSTMIPNTASVEEIIKSAKQLFDIPESKEIELKYIDSDKDKLSLSDMDDLRDFFMFCPSKTIELSS